MIVLFLAIIFFIHAVVFLRVYSKNRQRIHLLLTVSGFAHLSLYYAYRGYAYLYHPTVYLDWVQYLRWSGAVMSAIGLPPMLKTLYVKVRARTGRATAKESAGASVRADIPPK